MGTRKLLTNTNHWTIKFEENRDESSRGFGHKIAI